MTTPPAPISRGSSATQPVVAASSLSSSSHGRSSSDAATPPQQLQFPFPSPSAASLAAWGRSNARTLPTSTSASNGLRALGEGHDTALPPPRPSSASLSLPTSSTSSSHSSSSSSPTASSSLPSSAASSSPPSPLFSSNGYRSTPDESTNGLNGAGALISDPSSASGWHVQVEAGQRHRPRHVRGEVNGFGVEPRQSKAMSVVDEAASDDSASGASEGEAGESGGRLHPATKESAAVRRKLRARPWRRPAWGVGWLLDEGALARGRYRLRRWIVLTSVVGLLLVLAAWSVYGAGSGYAAALWLMVRRAVRPAPPEVFVRFPIPQREVVDPVDHAGLLPTKRPLPGGNATLPVYVIASCYNRLQSLQACLPTWLTLPEVTNVIIVDWASSTPVHESLREAIQASDGRLRIVRLTHPSPFTLPTTVNLGLHFFPLNHPSLLLKVDCDTLLLPGFMEHHQLTTDMYYAGDWRVARDENELHLNGVLFIHTQTFLAVNGYDERIQSYGYDDTNLHDRLAARGLKQYPMRYAYIQHQWHDDSVRTLSDAINSKARRAALSVTSVNSLANVSLETMLAIGPPFWATQRHRVLLDAVPVWNPNMSGVEFGVRTDPDVPHVYFTRLTTNIEPIETIASPANRTVAINEAAQIALRRLGFDVDYFQLTNRTLYDDSKYLMRLLNFYYTDSEMPSLVVDVQYGLSNRLRALASAAAVATDLKLALKVIWIPDQHCQARFSDLFRIPYEVNASLTVNASAVERTLHQLRAHLVWEDPDWSPMPHLLTKHFDVYNYMEQERGAVKDAPILPPWRCQGCADPTTPDRSVYVKTAYRLNSDAGYRDELLSQALGSLILADAVLHRLNITRTREMGPVRVHRAQVSMTTVSDLIGVHIRHQLPYQELVPLKRAEYTHATWRPLVEARNLTTLEAYASLFRVTLKANPSQKFYVTTDTAGITEEMKRRYGRDSVVVLSGQPCVDRTVACVQRALADQLLLGATKLIFGSVWSSFSEMAGLWRLTPVEYPSEVNRRVDELVQQLKNEPDEELRVVTFVDEFKAAYFSPQLLAAGPNSTDVKSRKLPRAARASSCVLNQFSILGERCSGTVYLQQLLELNFNMSITHDYHYKHFFGFENREHPLSEARCTLFVSVVRHPIDWLDSFYKYQWQLDQWRYPSWIDFFTQPIISYVESEMNVTLAKLDAQSRTAARQAELALELWHDRNFADPTYPNWKNIFELRTTKLRYMTDVYPLKVQHYAFVRLEDLRLYPQQFLATVKAWFNVVPRVKGVKVGGYVDAEVDADVVDVETELRGQAHQHLSDAMIDYAWQHLDGGLEVALGYHRNNSAKAEFAIHTEAAVTNTTTAAANNIAVANKTVH